MSGFFTGFNRRKPPPAATPAAAPEPPGPPAPEPQQASGSGLFRRARDFARRKLDELRKRREDKKKPPPQEPPPEPPGYPPPPVPPPPVPKGDVTLRARLLFTVNTGRPGGRHYDDAPRQAEHTLLVSMRFVEVLRDHVRAGRNAAACEMLTEPWYEQYLLETVQPTILKILRPDERAGARFFLTPNDVIEKPATEG